MTTLEHFWSAAGTVTGLSAVRSAWAAALGPDAGWAAPLLRPTAELAGCYPKPQPDPSCPRPYDVVCHDGEADDFVGVCPDDPTDRLPLARADLVVWELDVGRLSAELASALRLVPDFGLVPGLPLTWRVGIWEPIGSAETWVYLTASSDRADVDRSLAGLAARHDRRSVLLTPTRDGWSAWPEPVRKRATVAAAVELFAAGDRPGKLSASADAEKLLTEGSAAASPVPAAGQFGVGMLLVEDVRTAHPELPGAALEAVRKRLERWQRTHQDDVRSIDDAASGRVRYAYPRDVVASKVAKVIAAANFGRSPRKPRRR